MSLPNFDKFNDIDEVSLHSCVDESSISILLMFLHPYQQQKCEESFNRHRLSCNPLSWVTREKIIDLCGRAESP